MQGLRDFNDKMIEDYFSRDYAKILALVLVRRQKQEKLRPKLISNQQSLIDEMIKEIESLVTFWSSTPLILFQYQIETRLSI